MKRFVLFFLLTILFLTGTAQTPDFNDICKKYKNKENVVSIRINRFGCFLLSCLVKSNSSEDNIAQNFMRQSTTFQLLISDSNHTQAIIADVDNFIKECKLEELLSLKEKGTAIKILTQYGTKKKIQQLFISILQKDEEAVFLQVKGHFSTDTILKLAKVSRH
ncbi:DUF4252 domain-containing protein [uncultured Odoribacter sp.]|uniref:DUF4252 domain-containing protein n=1 Tax=uncultured Odoribacter sp. TaxID=876416 RepID=UPI002608966D|nr:DUF4252 domain-containing protein [uncultured Odoribacter sp.]